MQRFGIGEMEFKMAKLLWEREGIKSMEVINLCKEEFGWAKSTTFTMLRRLCDLGLFQNVNSVVTSVMSEEDYKAKIATELIEDKFNGSSQEFVKLVINKNPLSTKDKEALTTILKE